MDQLKSKIQELRSRFDLSFQEMLEADADDVHNLSRNIDRLHAKLFELDEEVRRVSKEFFKA